MTKGIFITGTDTDVGKSIVSAGILYLLRSKGYDATYFKAALSGAIEEEGRLIPLDTSIACTLSGLKEEFENITPYVYKTAVSPHLAQKIENNPIDMKVVKDKYLALKEKYDYIIAEGSGGIICPLIDNDKEVYLLEDLIKELNMNVIVVARAALGTINHTVLTVKYIESLGIKVKGIIINGYKKDTLCYDNINMIKKLTGKPILATIKWLSELNNETIKREFEASVNIEKIIDCIDDI